MSVKVLTASQMRELDRITSEQAGVPSMILMENAGSSVARLLEEKFPRLRQERVVILCGRGNNGGDGFVTARHLLMRGCPPHVALLADPAALKGDALANYQILLKNGATVSVVRNTEEWTQYRPVVSGGAVLVDALLGTGLDRPLDGFLLEVVRDINASFAHIPIVAVDMPSGLPSDTGAELGEFLRVRYTVTFTAPKWSQVLSPNCDRVGELLVAPIGTPASLAEADATIFLNLLGAEDLAPFVRPRQDDTHKGSFGHVLVVGGSRGKSGAAALSSLGALAAGAGLVTAATAESVMPLVAGAAPVLMAEPLAETDAGSISAQALDSGQLAAVAANKSVVAMGPGLSTHPSTVEFVRRAFHQLAPAPMVLDADGLNAFAGAAELLDGRGRKLILTPHPGEMARLTGLTTRQVQANRVETARSFAMQHQVCLVLKGYRTLIAAPGGQVYVNPTGNPGMATAGTGDVLTGIIAGLLAQHPDAPVEQIAAAAVYWHGAAGDCAARGRGELSLIATDLLSALPEVVRQQDNPPISFGPWRPRRGHCHERGEEP